MLNHWIDAITVFVISADWVADDLQGLRAPASVCGRFVTVGGTSSGLDDSLAIAIWTPSEDALGVDNTGSSVRRTT